MTNVREMLGTVTLEPVFNVENWPRSCKPSPTSTVTPPPAPLR